MELNLNIAQPFVFLFALGEMEERYYNRAEVKLSVLIIESDNLNRNSYSIRNKELEQDGDEELSSDHKIK